MDDRSSAKATGPVVPKRVCVIGNSYTGALRTAYLSDPDVESHFKFSFFATAGRKFSEVSLDNGVLQNVRFRDEEDLDVSDYDIAVIYGDFPTPADILTFSNRVENRNYSEQLLSARLQEWLSRHVSFRIAKSLNMPGGPAIYMLSRNLEVGETILPRGRHEEGVEFIRDCIDPATYIPVPETLISDDGTPREEFYSGSLNLKGEQPDRDNNPVHHLRHLNESGGRLILAELLKSFSAYAPS